ncbi:conserved Plasmodium protein, unknown function [Plasmodium malariae]|uniref:Uncharacterized protein n=1 Tax=Plasmodium malariae TaxID=5858 RepID=A0A1A8VL78_PLAMA|nr:conserved Plasmodium protein, unknown function [Plasmodium malariae]
MVNKKRRKTKRGKIKGRREMENGNGKWKRKMENGKWKRKMEKENGKWKMENGKWKMEKENGTCKREDVKEKMQKGRCKREKGRWEMQKAKIYLLMERIQLNTFTYYFIRLEVNRVREVVPIILIASVLHNEQVDEKAEKEKCENEYNVLLECLDKYNRSNHRA